mgnify:CR=1 FL=1|jgi:hypothetical protein
MKREQKPHTERLGTKSRGNMNGIGLVHRRNYQLDNEAKEITIWEEGNKLCLVNLLPKFVGEAVRALTPEICSLSEYEHRKNFKIAEVDELLRIAFWDEYFQTCDDRATGGEQQNMRMDAIYPRICSKETFYSYVIKTPERLAYMIKPPRGYMLSNRNLLEKGYQKFQEILELPLKDENGKINTGLVGQLIKMVILLENRVRGSVAHQLNINSQSLVANVNYEAPMHNRNIDAEIHKADMEIAALSDQNLLTDAAIRSIVKDAKKIVDIPSEDIIG